MNTNTPEKEAAVMADLAIRFTALASLYSHKARELAAADLYAASLAAGVTDTERAFLRMSVALLTGDEGGFCFDCGAPRVAGENDGKRCHRCTVPDDDTPGWLRGV